MGKISLWALGVVMTTMTDCSIRSPERQRTAVELATGAIPIFSSFVHDLVECWENIIRKLYFGDRCAPHGSVAYRKSGNPLFAEWRVEHPVFAKLITKPHATPKHPTESNVFAKNRLQCVCAR